MKQTWGDAQRQEQVVRASEGLCANCGRRPGTVRWGDALAVTHGFAQMWCEICALTKQLEHARERAALIPELEAKLEAARRGAIR